jgi:hypothetical protein
LTVSLTLPLSAYLRLSDDPGELDGHGPVAAGLARQIIRDVARSHRHGLAGITWRCVVTDDKHGTVLGVGSPLHVSKHDPPPRLADLIRTGEPTWCFPGCRIRARDCDLHHRIPYDPGDPAGDRGGGATCSCNVQPLCRTHHRLKTAGMIHVRAMRPDEEPGVVPGTLEFTTSTGPAARPRRRRRTGPGRPAHRDRDRSRPHPLSADGRRPGPHGRRQRHARPGPGSTTSSIGDVDDGEFDGEDRAWRHSRADLTRHRVLAAALLQPEPPF